MLRHGSIENPEILKITFTQYHGMIPRIDHIFMKAKEEYYVSKQCYVISMIKQTLLSYLFIDSYRL